MSKTIVIAIGGNSLIKDKSHLAVSDQYLAVVETCKELVSLVKAGHKLVITHGNGPQVGFILRRSELSSHELHMVPLDSCVADTQGAIGYNIQMAMQNEFKRENINGSVVTVVTQIVVDKDDPAFKTPAKPIGTFLSQEDAIKRKKENNWSVVEDAGRGYRRVVASPAPIEIIELDSIKELLGKNRVVVAVGGGGIPVIRDKNGMLMGVEAVIDKDNASALLAEKLNADLYIISTAVDKVCLNFNKDNEKKLDTITLKQADVYLKEGHFAAGSMLPKIIAAIDFVKATGNKGIITNPMNLMRAIEGTAGTVIKP